MYVVHENKSLINAKKSSVTSMSVIKLREREKITTDLPLFGNELSQKLHEQNVNF